MNGYKFWSLLGGGILGLLVVVGFVMAESRAINENIKTQVVERLDAHKTDVHEKSASKARVDRLEAEQLRERSIREGMSERLTRIEEALKWLVKQQGGEYPSGE